MDENTNSKSAASTGKSGFRSGTVSIKFLGQLGEHLWKYSQD